MAPIVTETLNFTPKSSLKKTLKHRINNNKITSSSSPSAAVINVSDKFLPLKKRRIAADFLIQLTMMQTTNNNNNYNSNPEPVDLSKKSNEYDQILAKNIKIENEMNTYDSFDTNSMETTSYYSTNQDLLSSECDSTSNNIEQQQSTIINLSSILSSFLPEHQSTPVTNNNKLTAAAAVAKKECQFTGTSKTTRNLCTSVFKNEKLHNELTAKLFEANIDEIDSNSPNTNMVRSFVPKERSETEKIKRERNTEAARISRRKRQILEKVIPEMAEEKEKTHQKLLKLKAAMMNYSSDLDLLLQRSN